MKNLQNIYDNNKFFTDYKTMREAKINANELIEIPQIKELLPDFKNKTVLDLGCGDGSMSRYIASLGAKSVLGVDLSNNMITEAKAKTTQTNISYKRLALEEISAIRIKFDVVYSSLAFHYVKDYFKLMQDISGLLKKGGVLVFSQEHPLATAPMLFDNMKKYTEIEGKRFFYLSDYNNEGKRALDWNVKGVIKYHRNFSTLVNGIVSAGMNILEMKESTASKKAIKLVDKYKYQKDKPYFIYIKAKKL